MPVKAILNCVEPALHIVAVPLITEVGRAFTTTDAVDACADGQLVAELEITKL